MTKLMRIHYYNHDNHSSLITNLISNYHNNYDYDSLSLS